VDKNKVLVGKKIQILFLTLFLKIYWQWVVYPNPKTYAYNLHKFYKALLPPLF